MAQTKSKIETWTFEEENEHLKEELAARNKALDRMRVNYETALAENVKMRDKIVWLSAEVEVLRLALK